MISVIIGGGPDEKETFTSLYQELGKPLLMDATEKRAFITFCKMSLRSTEKIKIRVGMTDTYTEKTANDDMVVYFPKHYMLLTQTPLLYKLATVIEVAIDLGLDVQSFSFTSQTDWNPRGLRWPPHWPSVTYYTIGKE